MPFGNGKTLEHRYGCSGFDGITFGPKFGKSDGKRYLTIAYGIYGDSTRTDNDYQVLLQYDTKNWKKYGYFFGSWQQDEIDTYLNELRGVAGDDEKLSNTCLL